MSEKVTVTVKEGKVRGFKKTSIYSEVEYYSFLGVPYGQSTTGQARFKEPVKVKPWNGVFDAINEKDGCIQFSLLQKFKICGSEDCLYNNIYTREIPAKGDPLKAVIVNIHPGGFYHGSPDPSHYGSPEFIIHHDIVYVCVGFRLNILGSLNLNLKDCSGNQNLKDIILSLRWIKDNIKNFGGDPENITIMGSSSGSAIVHFLLLSPLAKGLYHKAILMGMYVFSPALILPEENMTTAYRIGCDLGYKGEQNDAKKLLSFYKKVPMFRFIVYKPEHYFNKVNMPVFPACPFLPTYESPEYSENSAIPLPPEELIPSTNRVPLMVGLCDREGIMGLLPLNRKKIKESFYTILRQNKMGWGKNLNDDDLEKIQQLVESFYNDGAPVHMASMSTQCDIITDIALSDVYDSLINVISADLPSSTYVYKFQYNGQLCTMKNRVSPLLEKPVEGAFHAADYSHWCYSSTMVGKNLESMTPQDKEIIDILTSTITSFAKTGNPNCETLKVNWKPTNPDNPSYLTIDETPEVKDELLNGERMEFWHNIKRQFKRD
ncbi:esterase E4-like [Planococcus citri]|uniref:esterase E4-like n=1 Tax=Planococcus citri TaxID=170843 RepID=UPI0031F8B98E